MVKQSRAEDSVYRHHPWQEDTAQEIVANRQTTGLVAIVVILLLLIGGLFLVQRLHRATVVEDCLLAGRRNCDTLVTGAN